MLLAFGASCLVLQTGIANFLSRSDPMFALEFDSGNARIAVTALRASMKKARHAGSPEIRDLAERVLRRDPTSTAAMEALALDAAARGDAAKAERLLALSDRISRRSLPTRLWLIQRAVDRGDVSRALANIDIALRTSSAAPRTLFPVLARGITDPDLIDPIARMVDRPSDWRAMFIDFAADNADPKSAAALLLKLRDHEMILASTADRRVIGRLAEAGEFRLARRLEDRFNPVSPRPLVLDGDFSHNSGRPPFGWELADREEIGAFSSSDAGMTMLSYRAKSEHAGQVAAQLLTLPQGRYRLATVTAKPGSGPASPVWSLTCAQAGNRLLASLELPRVRDMAAAVDFSVAADCEAQWLTLTLRPGRASDGQHGSVASVSVLPR